MPRAPMQKPRSVKVAETRPKAASRRSWAAAPAAGCRMSENTLSSVTVMAATSSSVMVAFAATAAQNLRSCGLDILALEYVLIVQG